MGLNNGLHNGQPKTGAPSRGRCRSKALEGVGQICVGETGALITDLDLDSLTGAARDQLHIPSTMCQRVVHEVTQGVLQTLAVCRDDAVVGLDHDHPSIQLSSAAAPLCDLGEQVTNLYRLPFQTQSFFVRCSEQQELFSQSAEPVCLLPDRGHGVPKIITFRRFGLGKLYLGFDDRKRGTQLMTGIGQEPTLLLQGFALRRLGASDSVKHVVQGAAQAPDFVGHG